MNFDLAVLSNPIVLAAAVVFGLLMLCVSAVLGSDQRQPVESPAQQDAEYPRLPPGARPSAGRFELSDHNSDGPTGAIDLSK